MYLLVRILIAERLYSQTGKFLQIANLANIYQIR